MKRNFYALIIVISSLSMISCGTMSNQNYTRVASKKLNWETDKRSENEFKKYFDENVSELDEIEGIWSVNANITTNGLRTNDWINHSTVAIVKDSASPNRDFYEVVLSGDDWLPTSITAEFRKGSANSVYISKQYSQDGSFNMYNFTIDEDKVLRAYLHSNSSGQQISNEIYYIKLYPKSINKNSKSQSNEKQKSTGSGVLISESGYVITNYHVVENSSKIEIVFPELDLIKTAVVRLKDIKNDIVVLEIEDFLYASYFNTSIPFNLAKISDVKVGEEVFTLGFPFGDVMGSRSRLSTGTISSLYGLQDDPRLFQISNPLQPGNSGGPLFNNKGNLVGIVVSSLNAKFFFDNIGVIPQNINFAIKSNYIQNLISMLPDGEEITKRRNSIEQTQMETLINLLNSYVVQIKVY